jgi:hypothetical protein
MNKTPRKPGHNVVKLVTKTTAAHGRHPAGELAKTAAKTAARTAAKSATHGRGGRSGPDDARVKEAMRLAQAFLAIEDPGARSALIALAERLISYDWVRKVK